MGRSALIDAVIDGKTANVTQLIQQGARVDDADKAGWTALHFAARDQNVEITQLLLRSGAPANAQDVHGNTALFRAVFSSNGRVEVAKTLLGAGADKNIKNLANVSAFDLAQRLGGDIGAALR